MSRAARPVRSAAARVFLAACLAVALFRPRPAAAQPQVQWRELGPPARSDGAMVWDSRRGRALLFGGDGAFGVPYAGYWQFLRTPRPHWEPLVTTLDVTPPLRSGMCAVYDSAGDRVLLFGGRTGNDETGSNELWQLRLDATPRWLQLQYAPGPIPAARYDATMILDRDRRLVLFGGDGVAFQDSAVWILSLTSAGLHWRELDGYELGQGPGPCMRHGAAYSAAANQMLVFGGEAKVYTPLLDLYGYEMRPARAWTLSLSFPTSWAPAVANPSAEGPIAEVGGALVADLNGRYAWLMPGDQGNGVSDATNWRYDFTLREWARGHPGFGGPGPRAGVGACLEQDTGDILLHGGAPSLYQGLADMALAETWVLTAGSLPGWVGLSRIPGLADRPWSDPRAHFDATRRQLVTWTREGVWTCDVATDAKWHLQPASPGDGPQFDDAMSTIDPVRHRLLVFGGRELVYPGYEDRDGDRLWSWPLDGPGGWSSTHIDGEVPARINGTQCAFDAARDRVIALPAASSQGTSPLDTLPVIELASGTPVWAPLATVGGPPRPRSAATVIMDGVHDRLILQGGVVPVTIDGAHARDLWSLSLSGSPTWTEEIFSPFGDEQAAQCGLAVDPTLGRIMLVGGVGLAVLDIGQRNTIEATSFDDPVAWENLDPASQSPMLGGGPLFFDATANRMVWWNGRQLWQITWNFDTPAPYGPAVVNADAGRVHIHWPVSRMFTEPPAPFAVAVDRSSDGGRTWDRLRSVLAEPDGSLAFTDSTLAPGLQAAYRATIERSGATHVLGTASTLLGTTTPATLTLVAPRPNPARDDVVLELGAPANATVTIELFDVAGRLAAPAIRRVIPAGTTVLTAPLARGLRPGLYMLRASDGSRSVNARLVVVR